MHYQIINIAMFWYGFALTTTIPQNYLLMFLLQIYQHQFHDWSKGLPEMSPGNQQIMQVFPQRTCSKFQISELQSRVEWLSSMLKHVSMGIFPHLTHLPFSVFIVLLGFVSLRLPLLRKELDGFPTQTKVQEPGILKWMTVGEWSACWDIPIFHHSKCCAEK